MRLKKFLKKIYYKYILNFQPHTVVLRERISGEEEVYLINHKNYLQKYAFPNKKVILEIGFGNGGHIVNLAKRYQHEKCVAVVGVDLYKPGAVKVLKEIDKQGLDNLFISCVDAREFLKKIGKGELWQTFILFPDPWTKKHQHKKRLVSKDFLEKILLRTENAGEIILATDWGNYAESMESVLVSLEAEKKILFKKIAEEERINEEGKINFEYLFSTTFAKRAKREGREINIFLIKKNFV